MTKFQIEQAERRQVESWQIGAKVMDVQSAASGGVDQILDEVYLTC